jgi:hypothetical protein
MIGMSEPRLEPECRTCEDWGTVVIDVDGKLDEVACPDHVGSVPIRADVMPAGSR